MKALLYAFTVLASLLMPILSLGGETLTSVTFSQRDSVWTNHFRLFTEAVQKESQGTVKFRYVGGSESIPPFEQIEALRKGVVDVALLPAAYFVPQLPEADAMKLSPYTPSEERKNGLRDLYNTMMQERLGVFYVGRLTAGIKYHFYLKKAVGAPDFTGLKIRVTPIYEPFVRALNGIPITMAPAEVYVGLQRGVVDGLGWPSIGFTDLGWQEVVKYIVDPGFYQTDVCVLVNLRSWSNLSEGERKLLMGVMEKAEEKSRALAEKMAKDERELLLRKGLKVVTFEGARREEYLRKASSSAWEKIVVKSPEIGVKLKKMMAR